MQMGVSPEIVGDTIVDTLRDNGQRFPGHPSSGGARRTVGRP